jgi:hypothetical protein
MIFSQPVNGNLPYRVFPFVPVQGTTAGHSGLHAETGKNYFHE